MVIDPTSSQIDPPSLAMTPEEVRELARMHPVYEGMALSAARFEDVEVLEKPTLYAGLERWLAVRENMRGLYLSPTGGSTTGGRMHFPVALEDNRAQRRWFGRTIIEAGIFTSEVIALNLFAGRLMYRALEIFNDFSEQAGATVLPIECTAHDASVLEIARSFRPNMILGEPARLTQFARFLEERGARMPLRRVLYGGESLRAAQREVVAAAFETDSLVSIFGSAETGIWGYRTEEDGIDVFHYDPRMIHLEILDRDASGAGVMVVTNLLRRRLPVLRYRTGDRARWIAKGQERCTFQILGRETGSFTLAGDYFSVAEVAPAFEEVLDYQLAIGFDEDGRRDLLEVRIVPPRGWDEGAQARLKERLARVLRTTDEWLTVRYRIVSSEDLERAPTSRKVRRVIDTRRA